MNKYKTNHTPETAQQNLSENFNNKNNIVDYNANNDRNNNNNCYTKFTNMCSIYELHPALILKEIEKEQSTTPNINIAVKNITNLLTNKHVKRLLLMAKNSVFSRPDSRSSRSRFEESICMISREAASYFAGENDFSDITSFKRMYDQLRNYVCDKNHASKYSNIIKKKLSYVLMDFRLDFFSAEMTFHLLGSVMYGDAGKYSDIDGDFIIIADDDNLKEKRMNIIKKFDLRIDEVVGLTNQIRDDIKIIDLSNYNAVLSDIIEKETTEATDYAYKGDLFAPYDWLLMGKDILDLKNIGREINYTKKLIKKAAKDPFFEFLLCYKMFSSLKKRKEKRREENRQY